MMLLQDNETEKAQYLSQHVSSIKGHIKGLKRLSNLTRHKNADVLLFIPIEPAFLIAVEEEPELVTLALNHNIMLVSPTNLLLH